MKTVDLHTHSTASDGSVAPKELVAMAARQGLSAIAVTDHDTLSGIDEALEAAEHFGIEVIPGVEISCVWQEKELHMLGFYIDHKNPALNRFLAEAVEKRAERNRSMLAAFQADGFDLTMEDLTCGYPETTITRAHFARALLSHGYVSSIDQAFKKYLNPGRPYYRDREKVSPEESIAAIRAAGGFPVLAHPCQYKLGWAKTEELIALLKEAGLRGLECFHSSNNQEESRKLRSLAMKYGLAPTGGSDFHGKAKPDIELGKGRGRLIVPALYLDDIKLAMFLA